MLIAEILNAKSLKDIVDVTDYKVDCQRLVKQIHPDICKDPRAHDAFVKFQLLKRAYEEGFKYLDDIGEVCIKEEIITLKGNNDLIRNSAIMGNLILTHANANFRKYLPVEFSNRDNTIKTDGIYYSLIDSTLPEEHVRWILNRLLEFCAYMENNKMVHGGLSLESVLVNPITHGINVITFYHTQLLSAKVKTISAKYKRFYPDKVFKDKKAITATDISLAKGIACTLLGDSSGRGVKLKGNYSKPLIEFLTSYHDNAYVAMVDYKEMLKANYESKFYELKL